MSTLFNSGTASGSAFATNSATAVAPFFEKWVRSAADGLKSALPSAVPVPLGAVRVAAPAPGPTVVPAAQVVLVVASARQVEPGPKLTPTSAPVIPPAAQGGPAPAITMTFGRRSKPVQIRKIGATAGTGTICETTSHG